MLKVIVALVGIVILGYALVTWANSSGATLTDPITESATLGLKVKSQADLTVTVTGLTNRMKQAMAAGNESALRTSIDVDLASVHRDVDAACAQLSTLGDSPATIEQWLSRLGWSEFQLLEAEYRKAGGQ